MHQNQLFHAAEYTGLSMCPINDGQSHQVQVATFSLNLIKKMRSISGPFQSTQN